jgi:hypothetical protein
MSEKTTEAEKEEEKGINQILLSFPVDVKLSNNNTEKLLEVVDDICDNNTPEGCVMWGSGSGFLMTNMSVPEFDHSTFNIDVTCREEEKEYIEKLRVSKDMQNKAKGVEKKIEVNNDLINKLNSVISGNTLSDEESVVAAKIALKIQHESDRMLNAAKVLTKKSKIK